MLVYMKTSTHNELFINNTQLFTKNYLEKLSKKNQKLWIQQPHSLGVLENLLFGRQGDPVHVKHDLLLLDVEQRAQHVAGSPRLVVVALRRCQVPHQLTAPVVRATELVVADAEPVLCDVIFTYNTKVSFIVL